MYEYHHVRFKTNLTTQNYEKLNVDRRKMGDLWKETCIQKCLMGRLVKIRMKLARHVERAEQISPTKDGLLCASGEGTEEDHTLGVT